MAGSDEIENLMVEVARRRDEAEAEAGRAKEGLARLTIASLEEIDPDAARAAGDTLADAVARWKAESAHHRELRKLLMG